MRGRKEEGRLEKQVEKKIWITTQGPSSVSVPDSLAGGCMPCPLSCIIYRIVLLQAHFLILRLLRKGLGRGLVVSAFLPLVRDTSAMLPQIWFWGQLPKIRKLVPENLYPASTRSSSLTAPYLVGMVTFLFSSAKCLRH